MVSKATDRKVAGFFFAFAVFVWFSIPSQVIPSWNAYGIGARFFPELMAVVIGIFSVVLFALTFVPRAPVKKQDPEEAAQDENPMMMWVVLGLMVVYAAIMDIVGFRISTFIISAVFMHILGIRPVWKGLLVSLVAMLSVYYGFQEIFHITLPTGIFG